MLLAAIFLGAAILTSVGLRLPLIQKYFTRGPRREGVVVMGSVLVAAFCGWLGHEQLTRQYSGTRDVFNLLLIVAALYLLTAVRRRANLPVWVADILVIVAAYVSLLIVGGSKVAVLSTPISAEYIGLGKLAIPLTIGWMWLIARMTAAMNRAPQATGGYLGIVSSALFVLLLLKKEPIHNFLPAGASAALAGAGLATIPVAIKRTDFNIGWSAALALGLLLAEVATLGLLKNTIFFMLLLSLVAFGLPFLDVSFFHLRAALRGDEVNVEESQRMRLQDALLSRGVAPVKIAFLYLGIGAWLCGLGVLTARFIFSSGQPLWILLVRAVIVLALFFFGFVVFLSLARVWMRRGKDETIPENIEAFGVRISPVSMSEALDKIEGFIQEGSPHHVVTSDANAILRAQEDEEYSGIIRRAALITPDGFGVVWGARLLNLPIYERVTGVDMVTGICERAAQKGYRIFILGSEEGIAATAAKNLMQTYPGLQVVGTHHGMILRDAEVEAKALQMVRDCKPDVLFVAMGIPAQEKFIAKHMASLGVPVSLGVGGSFDVYAGKYKRAPESVQRMGMEWIYRVWIDPVRWRRMGYVPRFMAFALRTWIFGTNRAAKS